MTDMANRNIAHITAIERYCTHDGPGIRTTVFFKGCPLNCEWCHNPENISPSPDLLFYDHLCRMCGACADVCPNNAHLLADGHHNIDRSKCQRCFGCSSVCRHGALQKIGQDMNVDEMHTILLKDQVFYESSEGGVAFSGGEPLLQHHFLGELLPRLRRSGIHSCIQTCGCAPRDVFLQLAPLTDLFLWDVKHTDSEQHNRFTGRGVDTIFDNLRAVDALGCRIRLRCILIKGVNLNEEHFVKLRAMAGELRNCERIDLIPYHAHGGAKATAMGNRQERFEAPSPREMEWARSCLIGT